MCRLCLSTCIDAVHSGSYLVVRNKIEIESRSLVDASRRRALTSKREMNITTLPERSFHMSVLPESMNDTAGLTRMIKTRSQE